MSDLGRYKPAIQRKIILQALKLKKQRLSKCALLELKTTEIKKIRGGHFVHRYYDSNHDVLMQLILLSVKHV